jgi:hypothetical protein
MENLVRPNGRRVVGLVAVLLPILMAVVLGLGWPGGTAYAAPPQQEPTATPTVVTDKPDYSPEETVIITGSGFTPYEWYDIPVIRPNGDIVVKEGDLFVPGWDRVQADENGGFVYHYILNGILGVSLRLEWRPQPGAIGQHNVYRLARGL